MEAPTPPTTGFADNIPPWEEDFDDPDEDELLNEALEEEERMLAANSYFLPDNFEESKDYLDGVFWSLPFVYVPEEGDTERGRMPKWANWGDPLKYVEDELNDYLSKQIDDQLQADLDRQLDQQWEEEYQKQLEKEAAEAEAQFEESCGFKPLPVPEKPLDRVEKEQGELVVGPTKRIPSNDTIATLPALVEAESPAPKLEPQESTDAATELKSTQENGQVGDPPAVESEKVSIADTQEPDANEEATDENNTQQESQPVTTNRENDAVREPKGKEKVDGEKEVDGDEELPKLEDDFGVEDNDELLDDDEDDAGYYDFLDSDEQDNHPEALVHESRKRVFTAKKNENITFEFAGRILIFS